MMSMGELNLTESKQSMNQSNGKDLFRRCKDIIQDQMVQINQLTSQNADLLQQLNKHKEANQKLVKELNLIKQQDLSIKQNNQKLHKQILNLKKQVQSLESDHQVFQSEMQLLNNKNQLNQACQRKFKQQKEQLSQKIALLEETVQLLDYENTSLREKVDEQQEDSFRQISQLKQLNQILKKKYQLQRQETSHQTNYSNKINQLRYSKNKLYSQSTLFRQDYLIKPFIVVEEPFSSMQLPSYGFNNKQGGNNLRQCQSTDLKNRSSSQQKSNFKTKSKSKANFDRNFLNSQTPTKNSYQMRNRHGNPEMEQQLSNIKRQILSQYGKNEKYKQTMSRDRINHTLTEIETKLHRMAKVSQDSQSQFQ